MKKELKRQIKQDELVSSFERAAAWVGAHRDEARVTVLAVVLLATAAGGVFYFQSHRAHEAEKAFAEAMETFRAPVASELPPGAERPAGTVFATQEEKLKLAAAGFDGVERRYGSLPLARRARYYAALCRIQLGEYAEAEKALLALASGSEEKGLVPALARLALADLYRRKGETDKAAEAYRMFAADPEAPLPRDYAMMSLAGLLEDARRTAEAAATYRRLAEEFPASVYAPEARRRAEYLQTVTQG